MIETSEPKELGMRNDFREAMEKSEQECLNEIMNTVNSDKSASTMEVEIKDDGINFNEILVLLNKNFEILKYDKKVFYLGVEQKLSRKKQRFSFRFEIHKSKLPAVYKNREIDFKLIALGFKYLVKKWGQSLNNRSIDEKLAVKGKIETALHSQTVSYLKPLCRKLKSRVRL